MTILSAMKTPAAGAPLSLSKLRRLQAYWRAASDLSTGQICTLHEPLLRERLLIQRVGRRLRGQWGTTFGLSLLCAHFNRRIRKYRLNVISVTGPGLRESSLLANGYPEASDAEGHLSISRNARRVNFEDTGLPESRTRSLLSSAASLAHPDPTDTQRLDGIESAGGPAGHMHFQAHRVALADLDIKPSHLKMLEKRPKSSKRAGLFDQRRSITPDLLPKPSRRLGAGADPNGGAVLHDVSMPDSRPYTIPVPRPHTARAEAAPVRARGALDASTKRCPPETLINIV